MGMRLRNAPQAGKRLILASVVDEYKLVVKFGFVELISERRVKELDIILLVIARDNSAKQWFMFFARQTKSFERR